MPRRWRVSASPNNKVYRRNVSSEDERGRGATRRDAPARKTSETKGPGSTQKRRLLKRDSGTRVTAFSEGESQKSIEETLPYLAAASKTSRLLVLTTITTVPRVLRLLCIALWLHWSHWNAVKTKKNRYIPCSVTVTTLHRQLTSGAAATATAHARAYASWKVRARSSRASRAFEKNRAKTSARIKCMHTCERTYTVARTHLSNRCCSMSSSLTPDAFDRWTISPGHYDRAVRSKRASAVRTMMKN